MVRLRRTRPRYNAEFFGVRITLRPPRRGKNVPNGQKSLAYAFTYRAADKTLTDADVNSAHTKVVDALKGQLQAAVRE